MFESTLLIVAVFAIFIVAGTVKGVAGMGLPTTAIALMTLVIAPRDAIALVLLPMIATNAWQVYRAGQVVDALWRYRFFLVTLAVGVFATVLLSAAASERLIYGAMGGAIIAFVLVSKFLNMPKLPDRMDRVGQLVAGSVSGLIGGLTSVWAPPMAIYLAARQVDKDEFVRATGVLIFFGSVPLFLGYVLQGFLDMRGMGLSLTLILPALIGFSIGEYLRQRMSPEGFRNALLLVFFVLGLNLVRRAVF
jgi:uncharacterized membrane protein YfcA